MPSSHPINDILALLGRRWALRILWELRGDPLPYRRLREACGGISTSVLSQRLRELCEAGILEHTPGGAYAQTDLGAELGRQLIELNDWAVRWRDAERAGEARRRRKAAGPTGPVPPPASAAAPAD